MDNQWSDDEYSIDRIFDTLHYEVDETAERSVQLTGIFKAESQFDDLTPKYAIGLEDGNGRGMMIYVSPTDASTVNDQINEEPAERPFSHDLIVSIVDQMGGRIVDAIIDDVWQKTYYAKIRVRLPDERVISIDSRPSDAIVVAMKCHVPVYVYERVIRYAQQIDIE